MLMGHLVRARVISREEDEGGAVVLQIGPHSVTAMDCLGYDSERSVDIGEDVEVEFACLHEEGETWATVFASNPRNERRLERIGLWSYKVLGEIVSVESAGQGAAIADCGSCLIPLPISVSDPQCIGQFVGFTVRRLDAWRR